MLVLSRKQYEKIVIGRNIVVTITQINRQQVRVGIDAPKNIAIRRGELAELQNTLTEVGSSTPMEVR